MRLCIDLDGTLCEYKAPGGRYDDVRPLPGAAEFLRARRAEGHTVIIYTARHMKTCGGNVGLVVARQGQILHKWLRDHGMEYDELYFGKPQADLYIDDNALRFEGNWQAVDSEKAWQLKPVEAAGRLNIIVTMAGAGSRFEAAGYPLNKALIPVAGEPMYRHSVRSLPLHLCSKLIFVIRRDQFVERLRADIEESFAAFSPDIVEIDSLTRGQAETVLFARGKVAFHNATVIHNSDSAFIGGKFDEIYRSVDGALMTFPATEPRWSFAKTDETGRVVEVREKRPISDYASTGTYFFQSTTQLFDLIERQINANEREAGEYYIAPMYNKMIDAGQRIAIVPVRRFLCFGTPSDLEQAIAHPTFSADIEALRNAASERTMEVVPEQVA